MQPKPLGSNSRSLPVVEEVFCVEPLERVKVLGRRRIRVGLGARFQRRLGLSEGALRSAVFRLRRRWQEEIRSLVGDTVESEEAIDDELQSLAEMEAGLGMPKGALVATLERYNEHAERGEDPDFHKGAKWLQPLRTPPFAALDGSIGSGRCMSFTLGGLKVSKDGEVLREDDSVISGLYAIGGCASNIAQDGSGYSSGTCIGESTFFGRRAGLHAARQS